MPLARIITDVADDSLELTMQLRARGFQVETVAPGNIPPTPADLEVRLEECVPEDVVTRAAQVSEADDLWVFVAPGALDENASRLRTIPLGGRFAAVRNVPAPAPIGMVSVSGPSVVANSENQKAPILAEVREISAPAAQLATESLVQPVSVPPIAVVAFREEVAGPVVKLPKVLAPVAKVPPEKSAQNSQPPAIKASEKTKEAVMIPIAPEPVASFVILPAPVVAMAKPARKWNIRPWKVAFVSAALVIAAASLIAVLKPGTTASTASTGTALVQVIPAAVTPVVTPLPPLPGTATVASARPKPTVVKPAAPLVAQNKRVAKPRAPRVHGDDLIATDTVVFYDRKPGPARANAQQEPGVKRFSDR